MISHDKPDFVEQFDCHYHVNILRIGRVRIERVRSHFILVHEIGNHIPLAISDWIPEKVLHGPTRKIIMCSRKYLLEEAVCLSDFVLVEEVGLAELIFAELVCFDVRRKHRWLQKASK